MRCRWTTARYAIGDLARLAGVSRRTVRYYVQEGLIPPPLGVGRGNHYGPEHLDRILHVKAMQEAGRTLGEIRDTAAGARVPLAAEAPADSPVAGQPDRSAVLPASGRCDLITSSTCWPSRQPWR